MQKVNGCKSTGEEMTLFVIGLLLGMFLGAYLANKAFRGKVKKGANKLYKELEKLAQGSNTKQKTEEK